MTPNQRIASDMRERAASLADEYIGVSGELTATEYATRLANDIRALALPTDPASGEGADAQYWMNKSEAAVSANDHVKVVKGMQDEINHFRAAVSARVDDLAARDAEIATLLDALEKVREAISHADGCFEAALCEGLLDALADNDGERVHDLWSRRLSFARDQFPEALAALASLKQPREAPSPCRRQMTVDTSEPSEGATRDVDGRWFLGAMNDATFIIDKPPSPAMNDVGPWLNPIGPEPIAGPIDDRVGKMLCAAHNATLTARDASREDLEYEYDRAQEEIVALREALESAEKEFANINCLRLNAILMWHNDTDLFELAKESAGRGAQMMRAALARKATP